MRLLMIEALPTCYMVSISNSWSSLSIDVIHMITARNTIEYKSKYLFLQKQTRPTKCRKYELTLVLDLYGNIIFCEHRDAVVGYSYDIMEVVQFLSDIFPKLILLLTTPDFGVHICIFISTVVSASSQGSCQIYITPIMGLRHSASWKNQVWIHSVLSWEWLQLLPWESDLIVLHFCWPCSRPFKIFVRFHSYNCALHNEQWTFTLHSTLQCW